jgi:hypothetical protein
MERVERRRLRIAVTEITPATSSTDLRASDERDAIERAIRTLPALNKPRCYFAT